MGLRHLIHAGWIAAAVFVAGCGFLTTDRALTGQAYPATRGFVRVALESEPDPPQFEEIGIVRATGGGNRGNLEDVFEGLRVEAREIGANAVIRVRVDHHDNVISALGVAVHIP